MSDKTKGRLYIIGAALSFSIMSVFVKLTGDLPPMQKVFFRNFTSLIIIVAVLIQKKQRLDIRKENIKYLVLRSVFGTLGVTSFFYAISNLPLADANILNKLSPFILIILASIFLKEKVRLYQVIAIIIAFIGAYIVVRPDFNNINIAYIIGFLSSFFAASAYLCIRKLSVYATKPSTIIFCFSFLSSAILIVLQKFRFEPMTKIQFIFLICAAIAATMGQICVTRAYSIGKPRDISIYDYTQIVFAGLFGFLIFYEKLGIYNYIGYLVIISAGIFLAKYNPKDKINTEKKE